MDSSAIKILMKKDKTFLGCFAYDNLPPFPTKFPAKLIINTGASGTEGEHWVALLMNPKECLYFDSFGLPIIDALVLEYINNKYKVFIFSDICIQHHQSQMCGPFSIFFLNKVKNREEYRKFMNSFSHNDFLINEKIIQEYLKKLLKTNASS